VNRVSRLFVILSVLAAAAVETWLAAREWGPLASVTAAAFVVTLVVGRFRPRLVTGGALFFSYLAPAVFTVVVGRFRLPYLLVWIAGVLGAILATEPLRGWALPARWKWPLVVWALVVSASWPIVALREIDFNPAVLGGVRLANSSAGGLPAEAVVSVATAALTQGLGLLLFDWLYARYRDQPLERFERDVVVPLAASALLACGLGTYQGFVDIGFWSGGNWPALDRAAGSMVDANAFGMIAALWGPAFVAVGLSRRGRRRWVPAIAGFALAWTGLWSSGSRSALMAGAIAFLFIVYHAYTALPSRAHRIRLLGGVTVLAAVGLSVLLLAPAEGRGPIRRLFSALPAPTVSNAQEFVRALWRRNYYGTAAVIMIREQPLAGAGVGTFTLMSPDYTHLAGSRETFDNAQNWYRHQLAELGLIGSVGWVVWVILFIGTLVRTRGEEKRYLPAGAIKGALVALGAVSMLGVPAQSTAVTLTFWVFAFWYIVLAVPRARENRTLVPPGGAAWGWVLMVVLVAAHAAVTLSAARGAMRVPQRALRIGWNYTYGFYDLERPQGGDAYRWTAKDAVTVIPAGRGRLKLTLWIAHPDASDRPVDVRVWRNGELVVQATLRDHSHLTQYVPVPEGEPRLLIRTWVSRTWRPSDHGSRDARELGIAVGDWTFVEK
jgi:hypothetical protein